MKIVDIHSEAFCMYGSVITKAEVSQEGRNALLTYLEDRTEAPMTGNVYVADELPIHKMAVADEIKSVLSYKEAQFGYCHGNSTKVNALEWHECEELVFAATDCALYLGHPDAMETVVEHLQFNTQNLIAVQLKRGDIVRLEPKVMHFAPTKVNQEPYKTLIVLQKGTNEPLPNEGEAYLFMENKWMIAHSARQDLVDQGVWPGLIGVNYDWTNVKDLQ